MLVIPDIDLLANETDIQAFMYSDSTKSFDKVEDRIRLLRKVLFTL